MNVLILNQNIMKSQIILINLRKRKGDFERMNIIDYLFGILTGFFIAKIVDELRKR